MKDEKYKKYLRLFIKDKLSFNQIDYNSTKQIYNYLNNRLNDIIYECKYKNCQKLVCLATIDANSKKTNISTIKLLVCKINDLKISEENQKFLNNIRIMYDVDFISKTIKDIEIFLKPEITIHKCKSISQFLDETVSSIPKNYKVRIPNLFGALNFEAWQHILETEQDVIIKELFEKMKVRIENIENDKKLIMENENNKAKSIKIILNNKFQLIIKLTIAVILILLLGILIGISLFFDKIH